MVDLPHGHDQRLLYVKDFLSITKDNATTLYMVRDNSAYQVLSNAYSKEVQLQHGGNISFEMRTAAGASSFQPHSVTSMVLSESVDGVTDYVAINGKYI